MTGSPNSPSGLKRWFRRGVRLLLWVLALGILTTTALVLSLRNPAIREAILGWAGSAVEKSTGLHVDASDFAVSLRNGKASLYDLTLRADGKDSDPFLIVPDTRVELSWRSLLSERPQIYSIRLQEPMLDLAAPLPRGLEGNETDSQTLFPSLDIHGFELIDGSVRSGEAPSELDTWWDSWRTDGLTLVGSLTATELALKVQKARISIDSHRRPGITADLAAQLSVTEDREFAIDGLDLSGDGLELRLHGRGRLEEGSPIELTVDLRSNLASLFPDLTASGQIDANGELTVTASPEATLIGDIQISARDFPAELFEPLLAPAGRDGVRLEGTQLDLDTDLRTRIAFETLRTDPRSDLVVGEATLTWRRRDAPLVQASIRSLPTDSPGDGQGLAVAVEARILPRSEGSRQLEGQLRAPGWAQLDQLEISGGRFELKQAELSDLTRELGLTPEVLGGIQPVGSASLVGTVNGSISSPEIAVEGSWTLGHTRLAEISARSSAISHLAFRGDFLPDAPGSRRVQGGVVFPDLGNLAGGALENLILELDLPDLENALADLEGILESLVPDRERLLEIQATLPPAVRDRLTGSLRADLTAAGPLKSPTIELATTWVPADSEKVPADSEHLSLEAAYDGKSLKLTDLSGALVLGGPEAKPLTFGVQGQVDIETPIRNAILDLRIFDPIEEIRRLDVNARLEGGTLTLDGSAPSVPGSIEASIPLAILLDVLPESEALANLPLVFGTGSLEIEISDLGLARASNIGFHFANLDVPNAEMEGLLDALVSLDPRNPLAAVGTLEVEGLTLSLGETRIESRSDLRVDLGEGHIALRPARLQVIDVRSQAPLDLTMSADLDPDWRPGTEFASLVDDLELDLEGTIDSSLLTPFLAGGVASGPMYVAAIAQGALSDLEAEIRLSGPDASLVLPGRYRTRISEPEFEIGLNPTGAEIRVGRMRLNRGEVELSGSLDEDKNLRLAAQLDGVRYRLDHGLTVVVDGNLDLTWPQQGQRRLVGTIDVERGSLRRNLALEQELIRMLNPSDLAGAGSALQQSVDLDLSLITREGVRIKNNLADLRVDWDLIRVRGTLAEPTIAGRIDVDPGGLVTAYGQTVRIDQGGLIFSGVPGEPPRMDFETTSSAEDPRLRDQWNSVWSSGPETMGPGGGFWDRYDPQGGSSGFQAEDFTKSLTSYFQNRFLQSISGGAPRVELSVQPLPLMGETDTTARVTMSSHLTPQISYVLSQNPREAEGRTDILNLHNFAVAPSLQGQIFRNDQGNQGVTVQQTLEFGGSGKAEDSMPRLGAIDLTAPKEVRKRTVRRATGLRKGQPVADGADFDIEIDMLDSLARRGYPAAEVAVDIMPAPRNRVRVGVTVEPGTRVDFEFTGDQPRRRARQDIVAVYQPTGMEDSPALETIRRDTVRALRARGFLEPKVEVTPEHKEPGNPASDRIIRVHGEGGREVNPHTLEFPGLPSDVEGTLVALFSSRLSRVELATGETVADDLLSQSMQTLGYSEAQILSRELSSDGSTLVVEVEPGPRRHLATVQIVGVDEGVRAELDAIRLSGPGDPVRSGQISRTTFLMEDHLRDQGFANANVQARVEPTTSDENGEVDLFFDVEMGREHRVGELRTEGLANSSPKWVKRISKLETGELLTDSSLSLARRRLAQTGVFQRIAIRREEQAEPEATSVSTPITFELEEHPRYRVSYGLRGESTREAGVVTEVSDLNFLGRGQTLGLRLIYSTLERNARLYWSIPRIRQTNKNLEFFLEARREESVSGLDEDEEPVSVVANIREAWAQVTFPWGRRSVHRFYTVYKRGVTQDPAKPDDPVDSVVSPFSGWQVSYDTGERSFFETSTDRVTLFVGSDLSFSSENLGSDYTGYGLFGQVKPQIPLVKIGDSALVWVHNYRVGLKESRGGVDLPFFDRLFAGGEFSVRGYPTNSLGPQNDEGIPLGGEAMFVTNQELRFPLWTLLSGVAFFDAGNVWETRDAVESTLLMSIGLGLRADSPVGPLRLDFAYPLDRRDGDPEYKVYFGLGQTF